MNIDKLLNVKNGVVVQTSGGAQLSGRVVEIGDQDEFVFAPDSAEEIQDGTLVKISDGKDSVLSTVRARGDAGIRMAIECNVSPGQERRQDVRIYDKIYFQERLICHAVDKGRALVEALERIRANKLIIDSFLKGKYGPPGADEIPHTREAPFNQALWEVNRKLDLLIHMTLTADFRTLMQTSPAEVNISASGIRFITNHAYAEVDVLEVEMILPMVPLLFMRLAAEVIRVKPVTSYEVERFAVATRFLETDPGDKDDIIRYLFRRQREILRRRQGAR